MRCVQFCSCQALSSPLPLKSKLWLLIIKRWQEHHLARLVGKVAATEVPSAAFIDFAAQAKFARFVSAGASVVTPSLSVLIKVT